MSAPRVQELIAAFLDRHANGEQLAALDELLRSSPEALDLFVQCAQLDEALASRFCDQQARAAATATVCGLNWSDGAALVDLAGALPTVAADGSPAASKPASAAGSPVLGFLGAAVDDAGPNSAGALRGGWAKRWHGLLTPKMIALVVGSLLAGYFGGLAITVILSHNSGVEAPAGGPARSDESFATLAHSIDSLWRGEAPNDVGGRLAAKEFELERGLVELTLDEGVHVVIEGPTRFQARASNVLVLKQGRLVAHVPPMAVGFKVVTPTAEVIDLGTEFGVTVGDDAVTDVVVFRGKVEIKPQTKSTPGSQGAQASTAPATIVRLRAGDSRRVTADGITAIDPAEAGSTALVRSMPQVFPQAAQAAGLEVENYSFEEDLLGDLATTEHAIKHWQGSIGTWGVYNPTDPQFADAADNGPRVGRLPPPAAGKNVAYINAGCIYQAVGHLAPQTRYTLTVALGKRLDIAGGDPVLQLIAGDSPEGKVLAELRPTLPTSGTFEDVSLSFTTDQHAQGLLTIVLCSGFVQAVFDNVRLTAEGVNPDNRTRSFD